MKKQFNKIAEPNTVDSIAEQLRKHATAFHRTVRDETIQLSEFKKFCELCDATIIVRKSNGTEVQI